MALLDEAHRQHPADRDVLMALVSIARDKGDFATALRHARELVTLDPGNQSSARWCRSSKSASPTSGHAICRPSVDEPKCDYEVRNWHKHEFAQSSAIRSLLGDNRTFSNPESTLQQCNTPATHPDCCA